MNKKLNLTLVFTTVIFSLSLIGCAPSGTNNESKSVPSKIVDTTSSIPADKTTKDTEPSKDTEPAKTNAATETPSPFKYKIEAIASATKIEFNTLFEDSPLGKLKATIEGKGEKANAEGYSHIIIKDVNRNMLTKLTFENEEKSDLTARDLEWIDENNLFVILGPAFGTVSRGGSIYKVNVLSGETSLYLKTANDKEEFTSVHKSQNVFKFEKYVYEDDNYTKGHLENGVLELK